MTTPTIEKKYRFANEGAFLAFLQTPPRPADIAKGKQDNTYVPVYICESLADEITNSQWDIIDADIEVGKMGAKGKVKIEWTPNYPDAIPARFVGVAFKAFTVKKENRDDPYSLAKTLEKDGNAVISDAVRAAFKRKGNIFGRNLSRKDDKKNLIGANFTLSKRTQVVIDAVEKAVNDFEKKDTKPAEKPTQTQPTASTQTDRDGVPY